MAKIGRLQGRLRSFACGCRQKCVGGMFGTCAIFAMVYIDEYEELQQDSETQHFKKPKKRPSERSAFAVDCQIELAATYAPHQQISIITTMAGPGQSRGKGKALESIAARSGRDPAAIIDSIQAAEKAQAKAEAAKQRAAKVEASKKKVAAAKVASKKKSVGIGKGLNNNNNIKHNDNTDDDEDATKDPNEVNYPSQIYSSLSPQEQYRFQCYRRSGFASKPIEKFVAKMLVDEANRRFVARRGTMMVGLGGRRSQ
eukprot:scaffold6306_cov101-Skeletonema_dohrnii-CCMP3373.AAC.1